MRWMSERDTARIKTPKRVGRMKAYFSRLLLAGLVAGCGGGGDDDLVGTCDTVTVGPSLTVSAATNAVNGSAIAVVLLHNIRLNGAPFPVALPTVHWVNVRNVGQALECTLACGFTNQEGIATFDVSAPGYASKSVSTTAAYATKVNGCPGAYRDGASISVSLDPL